LISWLVLILLGGYIFHLERRVGRLERRLADAWHPEPHWEPEPAEEPPAAPAIGPETPAPEQPLQAAEPAILYAEPRPEPEAVEEVEEERGQGGFGFEELFGRRLPIWAGGVTLAVAGMLIVKLSIEAGLLSPPVRVIMGSLFGFALIAAAEVALRQEERVRDERVRQALAGAGIASLYASVLVAANLYQLIGPLTAMLGMALVTALALGLSLRFGAPSALLGLAGGLAAPALIGSDEPNIPLLSLYLALAVGGLCTVSRGQRWAWLGISALAGGFGWGLLLMLGGALSAPESISIALYLLLLGVALPMLGFAGDGQARLRLIAAIAAAAQMAALVATGGFSLLHWGLFGLISLAMLWLANREASLERLPPVGLVIVLLLLGAWPEPAMSEFAFVASIAGLIYGIPALWRLWRDHGGLVEAGQLAAIAIGGLVLPMLQFYQSDGSMDAEFGLLALALSSLAAGSAAMGWNKSRHDDARFAVLAISSALLLAAAATLLLPGWLIGPGIAAVGLGLLVMGQRADDSRIEPLSWIFPAAALAACAGNELANLDSAVLDALQWGLMAAAAAGFAWLGRIRFAPMIAQFLAPMLFYLALAPVVADRFEPLIAPLLLLAVASAPLRLGPAMWSAALMTAAWAIEPVGRWLAAIGPSLFGIPMFVGDVPTADDTMLKLLIPAALVVLSTWVARNRLDRRERIIGTALASTLTVVAAHSLYKLIFAIGSKQAFVSYGLAERTLWEALLIGAAALAWRFKRRDIGLAVLGAAAGHFALYTLLLHNPLWAEQAVGSLPLLNLIPLAYAVPVSILWAVGRTPSARGAVPGYAISVTWMLLVLLFAVSMLRQLFHGSILVEPGLGQAEDIARSILAIALAICFLLWGIRSGQRDWRIGSLVLMLGAVVKVFLWDTSGLEGLIRIASFVALGFSLIGIGWLYSRQLAPSRA
jgi:uncharacterized membrane protein